jgi:23S rRNA (pseudouridine1915-N3)-methyltransferase
MLCGVKLRFIIVGRDRRDPLVTASGDYLDRIRHYHKVELVELKEEPARSSSPVARVRKAEAKRIDQALGPGAHVVALDEGGQRVTSMQVAGRLKNWAIEGRSSVAFVIGGPNGLDREWLSRAPERWSLSAMTLPHRLARLVLMEQIYRGCTINRGEPYHK